jgi:hypothetical protein
MIDANQSSLNHLCASENTSEFERLATDYNTGRVKKGIRAVHHSHRIRIHDLVNSGASVTLPKP